MIQFNALIMDERHANNIAMIIRDAWIDVVKKDMKSSYWRGTYLKGFTSSALMDKDSGGYMIEVENKARNAGIIEDGFSGFHMPRAVSRWKTSKKGKSYLSIPMPIDHGLIKTFFGAQAVTRLKKTGILSVSRAAGRKYGYKNFGDRKKEIYQSPTLQLSKSYKLYRGQGMAGVPRSRGYTWKGDLFKDVKINDSESGRSRTNQAFSFRTMTPSSKGFYIPAREGKHYASRAEDAARMKIAAYLDKASKEDAEGIIDQRIRKNKKVASWVS